MHKINHANIKEWLELVEKQVEQVELL